MSPLIPKHFEGPFNWSEQHTAITDRCGRFVGSIALDVGPFAVDAMNMRWRRIERNRELLAQDVARRERAALLGGVS